MKRLQNRVAESRMALMLTSVFAAAVWLLSGITVGHWWLQALCTLVATGLMVELNNRCALIRIYSRLVSCSYLVLTCCACFLFPSLPGAIVSMCFVGALLILFLSYQDRQSMGLTYYGFLLLGVASGVSVHMLYFVPLLWILMGTHLLSLSWRTFGASLLGLATPYWFAACWLVYQTDFTPLADHFARLADFGPLFDYTVLTLPQMLVFIYVVALMLTGTVHYLRQNHADSIRIRLLYGIFIWIDVVAALFLILQPQHYDLLLRVMMVSTAPLIAHFLALTHTRVTNAAFYAICAVAVLLTAFSLWTSSSLF